MKIKLIILFSILILLCLTLVCIYNNKYKACKVLLIITLLIYVLANWNNWFYIFVLISNIMIN